MKNPKNNGIIKALLFAMTIYSSAITGCWVNSFNSSINKINKEINKETSKRINNDIVKKEITNKRTIKGMNNKERDNKEEEVKLEEELFREWFESVGKSNNNRGRTILREDQKIGGYEKELYHKNPYLRNLLERIINNYDPESVKLNKLTQEITVAYRPRIVLEEYTGYELKEILFHDKRPYGVSPYDSLEYRLSLSEGEEEKAEVYYNQIIIKKVFSHQGLVHTIISTDGILTDEDNEYLGLPIINLIQISNELLRENYKHDKRKRSKE